MLALWKISGEAVCRNYTCTCADRAAWACVGEERRGMCRQTRRCHGKWWVGGSVVFQLIQWAPTDELISHQPENWSSCHYCSCNFPVCTASDHLRVRMLSPRRQLGRHQKLSVLGWGTLCLSFVGASVPGCGPSPLALSINNVAQVVSLKNCS